MKTLGLLGGMSWESTALYYQLLNRHVRQHAGLSHSLPCIIHSFDFAIIERLQASNEWPQLSLLLCTAAQGLKSAGAEAIIICTNTMHRVADDVAREAGLPVLHIADFTGASITAAGLKRVGLLGTRYTMEQAFYKSHLVDKFELEVMIPEKDSRETLHTIIYEELVNGIIRPSSRDIYVNIAKSLVDEGAECIILGCTEIGMLLKQDDLPVPVFDTTAIHAEGAAEWALSP
ncbi:hypothetical protein MMC14_010670 [Varicellaria rhodocarpa]|nr:hypothetical protein [Varicellaria rhodocarpa]